MTHARLCVACTVMCNHSQGVVCVQAKLGTPMVRLLSEVAAVHALSDVVDVYDDSTSRCRCKPTHRMKLALTVLCC